MVHQSFTRLPDPSIEDELQPIDYHRRDTSKLGIATAFLTGFCAAGFLFILRQTFPELHSPSAISSRPTLPSISNTIDPHSGKPQAWFSGPCSQFMSQNCTFDLLSLSWLPADYLSAADREGEREFLALEEWKYQFKDGSEVGDIKLYAQDVRTSNGVPRFVYTNGRWHRIHCAFMFERLQRHLSRGEAVDSYIASKGHGEHCKHIVIKAQEEWEWERKGAEVRTRVFIKYPYLI